MKYQRTTITTHHPSAIRVDVPVRYEEDLEELRDFPFLSDGRIQLTLDLNDRKVRDWPGSRGVVQVHTKVCDEGSYYLLEGDEVLAEIVQSYVPTVLPGDHMGDYLILDIFPDGTVRDWKPTVRELAESFPSEGE